MTRGRETNHNDVVESHPDDCRPPSDVITPSPQARDVLQSTLATARAERSVTKTWHEHHRPTGPAFAPAPLLRGGGVWTAAREVCTHRGT